jgi:hypothetical protein
MNIEQSRDSCTIIKQRRLTLGLGFLRTCLRDITLLQCINTNRGLDLEYEYIGNGLKRVEERGMATGPGFIPFICTDGDV